MADKKISALTAATLPLAGTEVLPIVQSGSTVKVATDDLTVKNIRSNATSGLLQVAGPGAGTTRVMTTPNANFTAARTDAAQSFTGDQTLSTGNLIQGTAAKGVNFTANTPAAGMTSQLLNWYEEGTFTPVIADAASGGNVATISAAGRYTRIGSQVTITFTADSIDTTGLTAGNSVYFRNFPFTSNASGYNQGAFYSYRVGGGAGQSASVVLPPSSTAARIFIYTGNSATADTPLKVSDLVSGTSSIYFTLTYFV